MFVDSEELMNAIYKVAYRAESQTDIEDIQGTYVDTGVFKRINNVNDQIIFGRRGTGKTHLLKYAVPKLEASKNNGICVYIDIRKLSSASEMSCSDLSIEKRSFAVIKDLSKELYSELQVHTTRFSSYKNIYNLLEAIEEACSGAKLEKIPVRSVEKDETKNRKQKSGGGGIKNYEIELSGKYDIEQMGRIEGETEYTFEHKKTVRFPALAASFSNYLNKIKSHLFIIIDEWSSIPIELQANVAEFIKRVLLIENRITVKIGAIKARTSLRSGNIGMEIGADISGSINIDDYFIYDRDPELVTEVFEKILYQHITNSLEISMMYEERINSPSTLRQKIFLSKVVFRELTISAEGVIRDFLNIFGNCIALCERFKDERISTTIVTSAALKWYRGDKRDDLDQKEKGLLNTIVKYCIEKDVRAFLAPIEYRKHEILQRLVDRRTLHMLATSLELDLKEYDLYTIDYGAYSDFRNDGYSPIQRMSLKKKGPNSIQPFSCNDRWISFIKLK